MTISPSPSPDPSLFTSTVILITGTLGVLLLLHAPLLGLGLFGLAAGAAWRIAKRS